MANDDSSYFCQFHQFEAGNSEPIEHVDRNEFIKQTKNVFVLFSISDPLGAGFMQWIDIVSNFVAKKQNKKIFP